MVDLERVTDMVSTPNLAALGINGNLVIDADLTDPSAIEHGVATSWAGDQLVGEAPHITIAAAGDTSSTAASSATQAVSCREW